MGKKRLVALTGAGISAESGISTFRDSDGLWNEYRVEDVATPEGFYRNPKLVLDFYNDMRRDLKNHQPNYGHIGLKELEDDFDVKIITQNVDDLHERAGSSSIIHLHGELMKVCSSKDTSLVTTLPSTESEIHVGDKASDGSQLRPFIVWFSEPVPMIEPAIEWVEQADIFLIVGSSLVVYPAAGLVHYLRREVPIYVIDPKPVTVPSSRPIYMIQKGASEGMKEFISMVRG